MKGKPLRIEIKGGPLASNTRVLIEGQDITRHLKRIELTCEAKCFNGVVLHVSNIEVSGDLQALLINEGDELTPEPGEEE